MNERTTDNNNEITEIFYDGPTHATIIVKCN